MQNTSNAHRATTIEGLFAQICRATPKEARDLSMLLTEVERADLALFCYSRSHTREQGRAIAAACSRGSLAKAGGQAGLALADRVEKDADNWGAAAVYTKRRVSLAG